MRPQMKETSCESCGEEIRAVFIDDPEFYFCGKSDCKIEVLTQNGENPMRYGISPKEIQEYHERRLK